MWVVHFALGLTALYAAVITAMYFAQTWLLFPTALAGAAPVPTSTQYLEVKTHDGESLAGMRIRSVGAKAEGAPTLVGFGGNAWNAWTMAGWGTKDLLFRAKRGRLRRRLRPNPVARPEAR